MKTNTPGYEGLAANEIIEPRYTIALSFDDTDTVNITNGLTNSRGFDQGGWTQSGTLAFIANTALDPFGNLTADSIEDTDAGAFSQIFQAVDGVFDPTKSRIHAIYIKKDLIPRATRFCQCRITFLGSTSEFNWVNIDTATGESDVGQSSGDPSVTGGVIDWDVDYWRMWVRAANIDQANTSVSFTFFPAVGSGAGWVNDATVTGSVVVACAQAQEGISLNLWNNVPVGSSPKTLLGTANSDVTFLTSHADAFDPGGIDPIDRIDGCVLKTSGQTQKITPDKAQHTIGSVTIRFIDVNGAISSKINTKLVGGEGIRKKQIVMYKGFADIALFSDYNKVFTYLVDDLTYHDGVYTLICSDIQRQTKTEIFEPHQGVLASSILIGDALIPVSIPSPEFKFPLVAHDSKFSAHASVSVGYVKIEREVIAHTGWSDGTFTNLVVLQRGALNTKATAHDNPVAPASQDQNKKVEEYIYLEMFVPKMIYAILTGIQHPEGTLLPPHWNLSIDPIYVRLSDFTDKVTDLWDPILNSGRKARFFGERPINGKKFIEEQLLLWTACFMPVYSDGAYGLKKFGPVLPFSNPIAVISEGSIIKYSALKYDLKAVLNNIVINWNWVDGLDRYTKKNQLLDTNSISKHTISKQKTYSFRGVFTGVHTEADLQTYFDQIRDRYAAPPLRLSTTVMPPYDVLENGDPIRYRNSALIDINNNQPVDRVFEVQQVRHDWDTGQVTLELFGGVETASQQVIANTAVLQNAYYNIEGTELSTVLTIVANVVTVSGNLTGHATDNKLATYYFLGDLEVADGVVITCSLNVRLKIRGGLTINGAGGITTKGGGYAGGAGGSGNTQNSPRPTFRPEAQPGTPGAFGTTTIKAGLQYKSPHPSRFSIPNCTNFFMNQWGLNNYTPQLAQGQFDDIPILVLNNPDGLSLDVPFPDLRGTGGGGGDQSIEFNYFVLKATGGVGGSGGGGLVIIARGVFFGASGSIDTDGGDSTAGGTFLDTATNITIHAAGGSGGYPGGCLVLIDGTSALPLLAKFNSRTGHTPLPATTKIIGSHQLDGLGIISPTGFGVTYANNDTISNHDFTLHENDEQKDGMVRIQYIPEPFTPFEQFPADELDQVPDWGYGNPPPDWAEILDPDGTIPEDNATAGAVGLVPPNVKYGVGSTDIEFLKNFNSVGAADNGEIMVKVGSYFLPNATLRNVLVNRDILTFYEGAPTPPDGIFYVFWGLPGAAARFSTLGALGTAEAEGLFHATYNRATDVWEAQDNVGLGEIFVPLDTDYIMATGFKIVASGGIEQLTQVVARVNESGATNGAIGIFEPRIQGGVGSTDIEIVKNTVSNGTPNDGEIQFKLGTYLLPSGQQRVLTVNKELHTPYEGTIVPNDGVFYVIWGGSSAVTRFATLVALSGTAEPQGIFHATFNRTTGQWTAHDNSNNAEDFIPLDDDYVFGVGYKVATVGGITTLTQTVARVFDQIDIRNDQVITAQLGAVNSNPGFEIPRLGPTGFPSPASWFGFGSADPIQYLDATVQDVITYPTATTLDIVGAAIPVNPDSGYKIQVLAKYTGGGAIPTIALNIRELDSALLTNERTVQTHVAGAGADDISLFHSQTRTVVALGATNLTVLYAIYEGTYAPTATAEWFSLSPIIANNSASTIQIEWAVISNNADITSIIDKPDAGILDGTEKILLDDGGILLSLALEDIIPNLPVKTKVVDDADEFLVQEGVLLKATTAKDMGLKYIAIKYVQEWCPTLSAADNAWLDVLWISELGFYIACSNTGTNNRIMTSTDGISWITRDTTGSANVNNRIVWSPSLALIVVTSQGGTARIMTSPNGITWTNRTSGIPTNLWRGIAWSPSLNLFAAVAGNGVGNRVMTSPTGITWTARTTTGFDHSWIDVVWSPEKSLFVAVSTSATTSGVMTSSNGTSWAVGTLPSAVAWAKVVWAAELGIFCAVGNGNSMTSTDGFTWVISATPNTNFWLGLNWNPDLHIFLASAVTGGQHDRLMSSFDGVNWTIRPSPTINDWSQITWSGDLGLYAGVSSDLTDRSMVSMSSVPGLDVRYKPSTGFFVSVLEATTGTITQNTSQDTLFWTRTLLFDGRSIVTLQGTLLVTSVSAPTGILSMTIPFTPDVVMTEAAGNITNFCELGLFTGEPNPTTGNLITQGAIAELRVTKLGDLNIADICRAGSSITMNISYIAL